MKLRIIWKNLQYSYKQASISFSVHQGPQMLAISVLIVLSESFVHVCELRYLRSTILAFLGSPRLVQTSRYVVACFQS